MHLSDLRGQPSHIIGIREVGNKPKEAKDNGVRRGEIAQQQAVDGGLEKSCSIVGSQHWETQSVCLSYSASGAGSSCCAPQQTVMREASTQTGELAALGTC